MLHSQKPTKKSRVAFEWVLKVNDAVMKAETHARADHAKSRGVPLPDELAATIASYSLQMAACRAVKQRLDSAEQSVYEDLQCTYRGVVDEVTGEVLENCKPKKVSLVAFEWALMTNGNIMTPKIKGFLFLKSWLLPSKRSSSGRRHRLQLKASRGRWWRRACSKMWSASALQGSF